MANSDKEILITPNKNQSSVPEIKFTGANNTPVYLRILDDGTISIEGTNGQLFSVTDSMTGTIFSVNDVSGIPAIEVLDTGVIRLATYGGSVKVPPAVSIGDAARYGQPGSILQVVQTVKTDTFGAALSSTVWQDVPGMSVSITPKSTSSRILVLVDMKGSGTQAASIIRSRLLRDSTPIYVGNAAGSRSQAMSQFYGGNSDAGFYMAQLGGTFLDSPSTISAITYKMQMGGDGTTSTLYINRTQVDRDSAGMDARGASSITVMEVAN